MLLLAFQVQRKSILNFCAEGFIGKLNDSLARLAQKFREWPVYYARNPPRLKLFGCFGVRRLRDSRLERLPTDLWRHHRSMRDGTAYPMSLPFQDSITTRFTRSAEAEPFWYRCIFLLDVPKL